MTAVSRIFLSLIACSAAFGQPPADDGPSGIVRIEVTTTDGELHRVGCVVNGKRVATTTGALANATAVRVFSPDGAPHNATGIVSYNFRVNLALIAVDWGDSEVRLARLANVSKGEIDKVKLTNAAAPGQAAESHDGKVTWCRAGWVGLSLNDAHVGTDWGGAPVINDAGAIVGMLSGSRPPPDLERDDRLAANDLYATRVELIQGLSELPETTWKDWPARYQQLAESNRLGRECSAAANRDNLEIAKTKATKGVELDPRNTYCWSMLVTTRQADDEWEESIDACDKVIAIDPTDPFPHYMKSLALARTNRFTEALRAADRSIKLGPDDYRSHGAKGFVFESMQRLDEAQTAYAEANRLNPDDDYTKIALERVKAIRDGSPPPRSREPRW